MRQKNSKELAQHGELRRAFKRRVRCVMGVEPVILFGVPFTLAFFTLFYLTSTFIRFI